MSLPDGAARREAATVAAYDADAAAYAEAYRAWSPAAEAADLVALTTAGLAPGAFVLDVGSGSGRDLARLRGYGLDAVGVDVSLAMARIAAQAGPVVIADMRALPMASGSVAAVLAAASLLHLDAAGARGALAEFARVLGPGGRLVVSVKRGEGSTIDAAGRYFELYQPDQLRRLLDVSGFALEELQHGEDARRRDLSWLVAVASVRDADPPEAEGGRR